MSGFGAEVRREHVFDGQRRERSGDERRGGRRIAIEHDQGAGCGRADRDAGEERDLAPTDLRDDVDGIERIGPVERERAFDGVDLCLEGTVVDARAATGGDAGRGAGEDGRDRRGRSRVADAHVTEADDTGAPRALFARKFDAPDDECLSLGARHSRPDGDVVCAGPNLRDMQAGIVDVGDDAGIDDAYVRTGVSGEDVHRGAAGEEVSDHLRGDGLGVRAHAFRRDAVIRGRDDDGLAVERRRWFPKDTRRPDVQLFEAAEGARRLGELGLEGARGGARLRVRRADRGDRFDMALTSSDIAQLPETSRAGWKARAAHYIALELDTGLSLDALLEGVLDLAHLGDEIGGVDQFLRAHHGP